jgi:acyl-CoA synthetase (NDP forming)
LAESEEGYSEVSSEARNKTYAIIKGARSEGRKFLMEHESKEILKIYEIPTTRERLAIDKSEAARVAQEIGFPVVLKVCSPKIIHKSDFGGVIVGLRSPEEVKRAYGNIVRNVSEKRLESEILGILVQEMVPQGYEVIVGALRDVQFGPVVMFGSGGVLVEALKDVSFRLYPLSRNEILEMIKETKGFSLLEGFRGKKPADLEAIAKTIIKMGEVITDLCDIKEVDINPLIVHNKGVVAVDARIILR